MSNASHPLHQKIPAAIGILLITLVIVGAIVLTRNNTIESAVAINNTSDTTNTAKAQPGQTYKDGTYTEVGSYSSPAGTEKLSVTVTLVNNIVTSSVVMRAANDPTASSYQGIFISGYKAQVEGKNISDIKLNNVAGSSLTPIGFMQALQQIENDAKA
jgi:uncharacterized protein with FMN-binding domain